MKRLALTLMLLLSIADPTLSQEKFKEKDGYKLFPSTVEGLKQFPLGWTVSNENVMVSIVGLGSLKAVSTNDKLAEVVLMLVTIEGDWIEAKVKGEWTDMKLWMHEVNPTFGKYIYWDTVLILPRKKDGATYWHYEIQTEGRFYQIFGDKNDSNKVTRYENEVYRIWK